MTVKRFLDVTVAALALLILFPVLCVVAVAVRLLLGSPVLFRQRRPGLHGRPFILLKFRSMLNTRVEGVLLPDEARLTPFGRFLRRTSLDELPQLVNVLRGEISLVGPRPLRMEYLTRYSAEQARRHDVLPGITGLAQVSGRNGLPWDERFLLDVWYVEHHSIWLDLKILLRTAARVCSGEGINQPGCATAGEFTGIAEGPRGSDRERLATLKGCAQ